MNATTKTPHLTSAGLLHGLTACVLWGLLPLYFATLKEVWPAELLAHRVVWSGLFLLGVLACSGRLDKVLEALASPRLRRLLLASALLIALNWLTTIYAVTTRQTLQNSLGYFICPLASIALGVLFLGERLRPIQQASLALAACGLLGMIVAQGQVPWIALILAATFGLYGLARKVAGIDGLLGLAVETLFLFPVALGMLLTLGAGGRQTLGQFGWCVDGLLLCSGFITAVPLICYGQAARQLPLSTLGLLHFVTPSCQLLLAVLVFEEPWGLARLVGFGSVWGALALVSIDSLRIWRKERRVPAPSDAVLCHSGPARAT